MFLDPFEDKKKLLKEIDVEVYKVGEITRVVMRLKTEDNEVSSIVSATDISDGILNYLLKRMKHELVDAYLNEFIKDEDVEMFLISAIRELYMHKKE